MTDGLLRVEDLVIRYGPIVAVREVSIRVEQGEIVALLGANGAGKSSFLNGLAGLVPVASGRVVFRGEELQRLVPEQIVRRGLGLTPEGRRVFPRLSVADNLRLGAVPQRDRTAAQLARERVLTLFPILRERMDQVAGTLSGGQQQMLAIGRSLMAGPSLLLLDEPSLGLAPILVDEVFALIQRLREEGTTILLVEQNVHRALEVADRAYVLANGVVEREGPAAELRADAEIEKAYLGDRRHVILADVGQEAVQQAINALALGSTYALLALGLAMVFSILGLVNFAHGELVTVAAYTMYLLYQAGVPFWAQVPSAIAAAAVAAVLMERIAFRPLRGASFITLLFASFALSVIIQNIFLAAVSPRQKGVPMPDVFNEAIKVGPFTIGWLQVITTITCFCALAVLTLFLRRSTQGLGMLAAAQDFQVTRLMGIPANRVIATAFAISGALAGIAAIFILARRGTVEPGMGFNPVLKAFIASVIGGLGSLAGAVVGGFVLAAIEVGLDASLPNDVLGFRDAFALAIVIAILYFRPDGLLVKPAEAR